MQRAFPNQAVEHDAVVEYADGMPDAGRHDADVSVGQGVPVSADALLAGSVINIDEFKKSMFMRDGRAVPVMTHREDGSLLIHIKEKRIFKPGRNGVRNFRNEKVFFINGL